MNSLGKIIKHHSSFRLQVAHQILHIGRLALPETNSTPRMTLTILTILLALELSRVHAASDVLIVHSTNALGDVPTALSKFNISSTTFNASVVNPTLAEVLAAPCVLVITSDLLIDSEGAGDVLADYVDAGGRVVVAMFGNVGSAASALGGRFRRDEMHPIPRGIYDFEGSMAATLVPVLPQHTLLNGVNSISCSTATMSGYCFIPLPKAVAPGAVRVADWSTGAPLAAIIGERFNGITIGLGLYPRSWNATANADATRLVANAIRFQSPTGKDRNRGDFCDANRTCKSQLYCTQSVCCDTPCSALCESCRARNKVGTCVATLNCGAADVALPAPTPTTPTPTTPTPATPIPASASSQTGLLAGLLVLAFLLLIVCVCLGLVIAYMRRIVARGAHVNEPKATPQFSPMPIDDIVRPGSENYAAGLPPLHSVADQHYSELKQIQNGNRNRK